jgi:hypothetical protein
MTADPYKASAGAEDPGSWNRYSYVGGDPVNFSDPSGFDKCAPGSNCVETIATVDRVPYAYSQELRGLSPSILTVREYDDIHGFLPRCLPLPKAVPGVSGDQIANNVAEAQQFYGSQMAFDPANAFGALMGFLAAKFVLKGPWDYKKNYSSGSESWENAKTLGNFNFGAVLQSFWFNYTTTQSVDGVTQIGICIFGGGCGAGTPFKTYPFGDQIVNAVAIRKGFNCQAKLEAGCR